jgi:hypothetical protein
MDSLITINGNPPNLFCGLLSYRPRADRDSHENFLTESFAYLLAKDPAVATKIVNAMVGEKFKLKRIKNIRTQVSLGDENGRGLPDMMIEALEHDEKSLQIWVENKWNSCADLDQISRYASYLKEYDSKARKHLTLLTPRHTDAKLCFLAKPDIELTHITWSRIHEILSSHQTPGLTKEFAQFLYEKSLIVQAITRDAALAKKSGERGADLRQNLWTLCSRVQQGLTATALTRDVTCHDGYGRVALWMFGCRLSLGVLFDPTDHATRFLDERRPLDLIFRIEGPYTKASSELARAKLSPVVKKLEKAGFDCERYGRRANHRTLVLGHYREGFPFDLSADEQVARLTEIFDSAQLLIAKDESLMRLLNGIKSY